MAQPNFTHSFTRTIHRAPTAALSPEKPSLSAEGKTVLVTAGATGIGFSISTAFAAAHATNLILLSRRESVLTAAAEQLRTTYPGTKVYIYPCDVTDIARVREVFLDVKETIGEIDIVVTSHIPFQKPFPVAEAPAALLLENFNSIVLGNVNVLNIFLEVFPPSPPSITTGPSKETDKGKEKIFVNISSLAAHVTIPTFATYSAAKAATLALLQYYHMEHASHGLRIHSVHPGGHYTEASKAYGIKEEAIPWDDINLPGRFVLWLCSDKARFLMGRFVHTTWDVEELEKRKLEFEEDADLLTLGLVGCGGHEVHEISGRSGVLDLLT